MKKIIILLLVSVFLISCGMKNEEVIEVPAENSAVEVSQKLLPEEEVALEKFMQEYEAELKGKGFSEEIIAEAVKKIREEKTTELLSN